MPVPSLENLDKSTWREFRFDEIAQSIGERVEPTKTDLEIYVGLDHIDSESIHIKRFGKREDVSGTKLRCYPGDVIFGRRRAYQRKAAICEFDGFCSAHSLVLRARPELIDPKLFPFFLHSDTFMHRAVDISVGSLSPTINWGTLKKQEFLLPPKDQQAKLGDLLWAADRLLQNWKSALVQLERLLKGLRATEFRAHRANKKIEDVATVRAGIGFPLEHQNGRVGDIPFIKVADMNSSESHRVISVAENHVSHKTLKLLKGKIFPERTIIFPKVGAAIATEKKRMLGAMAMMDNNIMGVTILDEDVLDSNYLFEYFNYISISALSNAGTVPSINAATVNAFRVPVPKPTLQQEYLCNLAVILKAIENTKQIVNSTQRVAGSLVNKMF